MPRSNEAVADMLTEFAELLAISGADPFKIRAYERAARSVRGHTADLTGLDRRGLRAIPGVGDQLATKIKQYLDTGTVTELDTLRAEVPAGLRALLAVPGLGPRRAHQVFQERGITSTAALRDALRHGHLRDLRGWGPRTEENLTAALRETQRAGHRIPLALALDLADQALGQLTALPGAQRAEVAGSVRRRRDTVGDLACWSPPPTPTPSCARSPPCPPSTASWAAEAPRPPCAPETASRSTSAPSHPEPGEPHCCTSPDPRPTTSASARSPCTPA
ncbi:helix-hairpin-helix domain-containing protein [Actinoalloteichus caeruleus]|uniref:helix-hairpin-helix domain-containing protein n=1 Tax=Actinoalloteichus cyanogriseus TaxID=2893586 RepID=UPI000A6B4EA1|nr:helix-hairpin-helix domain-containing protein [Actinoalloteichus caeruleus]